MSSRFDEEIERVGTHSSKWDMMETIYGVSPEDGIAMWVADMDFRPPDCVQRAVQAMSDHGVYGYFGNDAPYREAICWWMCERHGWEPDPASILTTNGIVNGVGLAVDTWTDPGDGVVLFTPVYHAFGRVIRSAGREVVECPLAIEDGVYTYDFDAYDAAMTGREKMVVLCSPHNPGGRVWTREELRGVADVRKAPRPDPRLGRDSPRSRHARREPRADDARRARGRGPAGDDDVDDEDLQHRGLPHRQRDHP